LGGEQIATLELENPGSIRVVEDENVARAPCVATHDLDTIAGLGMLRLHADLSHDAVEVRAKCCRI
jgi:hypothetical protein